MKINWLVSTAASMAMLSASYVFAASDPAKICTLLTREELAGVGVAVTGLFADDPVSLKKDSLPGLITDMQVAECTSEMATQYTAFPVRWSVATTKDLIDKKAWDTMSQALDGDEKQGSDPAEHQFTIDGVDCETFSWPQKDGKRIYAASCTAHKRARHLTLEFAQNDKAKLPSAKSIKHLIDKMLSRQ